MSKTQKDLTTTDSDWLEEYEGQLAIDVYQDNDSVVIKAPIAGVKPEDLEISITDEVVNIKGERRKLFLPRMLLGLFLKIISSACCS